MAAVDLQSSLDLKAISSRAVNADYDPGRFEACVMRIRKPKTTAMVFENGKMIVTGARNDMEIKSSAKKFGRIIKKLGFEVKISQPKIQSIVAECETNFSIRIEDMAFEHADYSHVRVTLLYSNCFENCLVHLCFLRSTSRMSFLGLSTRFFRQK